MKVLLTGANGQLGRCLQDRCPAHWQLLALGHGELDIRDAQAVSDLVAQERPDGIINAAAYTAVDQAENDVRQAHAINAHGAAHLAQAAGRVGARLLHVSTDYVFDGAHSTPYTEHDTAAPLNAYGRSKLQGENAVLQVLPHALVLRTSAVYSEYGNNFVKTMLRLAQQAPLAAQQTAQVDAGASGTHPAPPPSLRIVADQHTCPTYAGDLADAIIQLLGDKPDASGIYHYCGATPVSWYEFARTIFDYAGQLDRSFISPGLQPIAARDYAGAAPRPAYSVLSCERIQALGVQPMPLQTSLPGVIKALMGQVRDRG